LSTSQWQVDRRSQLTPVYEPSQELDVQGPQTHQWRFINLYEYKGVHIEEKTQKALDGECKFDRTKEEGRRENWTFLMIGTCKSGEED
jgi:hypothetical protein